jgi:hypothetical protein
MILPHPCPVALFCRALRPSGCASPTPAPRQTHARQDPHLSGLTRSTPPGYPPLSRASLQPLDPHQTGIPAPWPCSRIRDHRDPCPPPALDPSPKPVPQLAGIPAPPPTSPPPFRPCWAPAMRGTARLPPSGPAELQLCVERLEPHPAGQAPAWQNGPSSTGFPDNRSTRLPLRPPLEG